MGKKYKLAAVAPSLPPQRAALVENRTALAAAEAAHAAAVAHRDELDLMINGPRLTEQQIREQVLADKDALQEWVRSGAIKAGRKPEISFAKRIGLEQTLEGQRHAAELAAAAMSDAEADVERTASTVTELRGKIADIERGVVMEVANEIGQHYLDLIDKAVTAWTTLKALDLHLTQFGLPGIGVIRGDLSVPVCSLPCMPRHAFGDNASIEINEEAAAHLVPRWAELAKVLADDPTADPKAVFDWAGRPKRAESYAKDRPFGLNFCFRLHRCPVLCPPIADMAGSDDRQVDLPGF
jgi:hypothetical protein